jgi:hypothetical protein
VPVTFNLKPNGHVMALTITAATAAAHIPAGAAPPPEAAAQKQAVTATLAAQPSAASATASRGPQQAALQQLLVKYSYDLSQGANARILSALGKQITAAAKALGQHVTLPHPPASSGASSPTQTVGSVAAGKINVTA